ncbi:molybdopterin-synthase adenylyltransferase MoeB [Daejeonella sp.]|uniref:molybdopterin-synthase adenylyltransferase MoeB n=1 Tax=Daejeonella sp. TaxID=2805397 RepID=UPI0039833C3C
MAHNHNPRYQRQTTLKEFGEISQEKLTSAKVLVIGAGGLGCPALQYLAGAGIGTLGLIDHDTVSLNNLHRQVLYSTDDIGLSKAVRAADILRALNPEIDIIPYNEQLNTSNAINIISQFDIVLDGTDNFASRYMINDACVLTNKALIYGAISRFEGQIAVFNCDSGVEIAKTNYRDLFPDPPAENETPNCAEAGVIGVLPGIIGTMMANEAIKLITGIGTTLINRLMTYNSLTNQVYEMEILPRDKSRSLIPANIAAFQKCNYELLCFTQTADQIDLSLFDQMMQDPSVLFIDVRELNETPLVEGFSYLNLPLSKFERTLDQINAETVVLFCQSGKRSLNAARMISERYGNSKKVYSLQGGILAWKNLRRV